MSLLGCGMFRHEVGAAALVMAGGGAVLGAAAAGLGMAGAVGRRGNPRVAGFALQVRGWALAWAWVWQRVGAVVWRRVCLAPWWWSWVLAGFWVAVGCRVGLLAGLRARASVGCATAPLGQ